MATYLYSGMERVYQSYYDTSTGGVQNYTLNIFPSLRLERALASGADYIRSSTTEVVNLAGMARVVYGSLPSPSGNAQHVFLELSDPIGSTDIVIDRETSELVERRTEQVFGSEETDYRPARWNNFREDFRWTGKEDDIAFGLSYFGARYYAPALGRWMSPDPLAIHGALGDLNPYAYVGNSPLSHRDLLGLLGSEGDGDDEEGSDEDGPNDEPLPGGYGAIGGAGGGGGGGGGVFDYFPPPPPPVPRPVYGPPLLRDSGQVATASSGPRPIALVGKGAKDTIIDNAQTGIWATLGSFAFVSGPAGWLASVAAIPVAKQGSSLLEQAKAPLEQRDAFPYQLGKWFATAGMAVLGGAVGGAAGAAEGAVENVAAEGAAARTFTSADPLVADLANAIEKAYPGHVVGVNVPMYNAAGQLATDADILLQNAVIQVKSGSGAGLTSQLLRTQAVTDLPVIGYAPNLGGSLVRGIQAGGGLVTRDPQLLIDVVAP